MIPKLLIGLTEQLFFFLLLLHHNAIICSPTYLSLISYSHQYNIFATPETVPNITERLADLTARPSNMTGEEVEYAVQVIDRVVWSPNSTLRLSSAVNVMKVYDNMLQLTDDILLEVELHYQSTSRWSFYNLIINK